MNLRPLPALLLALLVPFCAFAGDERIAYTCDNNSRIDISFLADISGRPQATLHFADQAVVLPQVPAASGALYRSGDIRLATKGDDAIFEDGKNNLRRCTRGSVAPVMPQATTQPAAASSFIDIAGRVSYLARIALPANAILKIRIQSGRRTLADQRYELNGAQVPIPFSATVDRDLMGKKASATVSARIEAGGKLLFVSAKPTPATKNGQPVPVNIMLKPATRATSR
ncbi:YbaY family lipoprotein [Ferribacterium limneticum]|uniref:YbaY family lipoprotein n=1 Tax=Ferribacterium limneticum TaxID=76259 RepID=UPI001CFA9F7F|nr:YbaY family lipoprotein [Ferribacterium limneticum]UCV18323.1 YbaY family lipoprotein [Ferribacterium limneticum]